LLNADSTTGEGEQLLNRKKALVLFSVVCCFLLALSTYSFALRLQSVTYNNRINIVGGEAVYLLVFQKDGSRPFEGFNWTLQAGEEREDRLWLFNNRTFSTIYLRYNVTGLPPCYELKVWFESAGWMWNRWLQTDHRYLYAQEWASVDIRLTTNSQPINCTWKLIFTVTDS